MHCTDPFAIRQRHLPQPRLPPGRVCKHHVPQRVPHGLSPEETAHRAARSGTRQADSDAAIYVWRLDVHHGLPHLEPRQHLLLAGDALETCRRLARRVSP